MAAAAPDEVSGENIQKAEELKSQANEYFKTEKYPQAVELYTQCIKLNPVMLFTMQTDQLHI